MGLQETFIKNLKYFRKQKKITQNELTLKIDMGLNYINGVEQGAFFPQPYVIDKIAEALDIRPGQLFDENASPKSIICKDSENFIEKVTSTIYARLRTDIKSDITTALNELIK